MRRIIWILLLGWSIAADCGPAARAQTADAPPAPANLTAVAGDRSVALHWDAAADPSVIGYNIYRSADGGADFEKINGALAPLLSFADLDATNGVFYWYAARAENSSKVESANSAPIMAAPRPFASADDFFECVEHTAFDYFWYEANPANGLVRDRSELSSACSIAAVGFGLTGIGVAVDHGWISRTQGRDRALATLKTFWQSPQGTNAAGMIGYRGWFYHFLDMASAARAGRSELSSIDTALFLAGALSAQQYFDGDDPGEAQIRDLAGALFDRVDWRWMTDGRSALAMGWLPESGFLPSSWTGYNEGMLLYVMAMGAAANALPEAAWSAWTKSYRWETSNGYSLLAFPPLFGHQYSHCWIDFRHIADDYMRQHSSTYFENSRRATLAQRNYCIANPGRFLGYSSNVWGLTACDGPGSGQYFGYTARGAPPAQNDDGTIAPTAAVASLPFTPVESSHAMRALYDQFRARLWTGYGFRDAFNLQANWWDPDVLGIDQGPILLMIENARTQSVWRRFMRLTQIQRGLQSAGFQPLSSVSPAIRRAGAAFILQWALPGLRAFQVEHSPDLVHWFELQTGLVDGADASRWTDAGPPDTPAPPLADPRRFYRVFNLGALP